MNLGKLITFEGGECAGKGTHIKLLKNVLEKKGYTVNIKHFEPGSTPKSEIIRAVIKNKFDTDYGLPRSVIEKFDLKNNKEYFQEDELSEISREYLEDALKKSNNILKNQVIEFLLDENYGLFCFDRIVGGLQFFREPSKILFKEYFKKEELNSKAQAALFFAARNILYDNHILKSLKNNDFTIIDRSIDSTIVYQGYALQNPETPNYEIQKIQQSLREENLKATRGITPHLTLFLDIPINEIFKRLEITPRGDDADYFDGKGKKFHERVRQGYLNEVKYYESLPKNNPQHARIKIVDTNKETNATHKDITELVTTYFNLWKSSAVER